MADTPFPRLSKSSFQVVQTWLHRRSAAIEVALACPVLESQKAEFTELLMAEGRQISTFIAAYPNSNNLSIDSSLAKLILQCQASQSALAVLTSMSDSSWAEKPKAQPSDVFHVPLPATQQWWRPFHEAAQKQVFLSPMAGVESSDADHFQYLRKTHKDLREQLIFADSELRRNSDKVHTTLAAQVSKRDTLQWHLELYQVTVNLLKERNADLQERVENSEALAAVQQEELQDLHCQLAELESLSTGAPMPDISYPGAMYASRFPYTDADKENMCSIIPFHTQMSIPRDLYVEERLRRLEDTLARSLEQAEATEEISARITARFTRLAGRSERRQRKLAHLLLLEASLVLLEEGNDMLSQRLSTMERLSVEQKQELQEKYRVLGEMNTAQSQLAFGKPNALLA
ncbi:hypothetical protein BDN67DRAFT_984826 [Paxillus ammoniavirescens]|nr:hypothetical protein BDN67DRAFT_984826 [Paxillus ammoniavirescens]